jgi:hypothetical protein
VAKLISSQARLLPNSGFFFKKGDLNGNFYQGNICCIS